MTWGATAIVAMTGQQPDWPLASLSLGPLRLGYGSDAYLKGLRTGIVAGSSSLTEVLGEDCIELLAKFRQVILWHFPGQNVLRAIRAASKIDTQVALACAYEALPNSGLWSTIQAPLEATSRQFTLNGNDGKPVTNSAVTWIDVANQGYAEAYVSALAWVYQQKYGRDQPDATFYDSTISRPYYGGVANAPVVDSTVQWNYQAGWNRLIREHQGRIGPIWGNPNVADMTYLGLTNRYLEHGFGDAPGITTCTATGRAAIGFEGTIPVLDQWQTLQKSLAAARNDHISVVTCRTGRTFGLFWPSGVVEAPR